jgi:UDP-glucose 4-epimerase
MRFFVTGGAGFIGSHLVDELMKQGECTVYDDLSLGKEEHIANHKGKEGFNFIKGTILDLGALSTAMKGADVVFHLAANSDIKNNEKTDTDLNVGVLGTHNVLEAMRKNNVKKICFSSTSAVYGEEPTMPTPESYGPLFPISFYGASKLSAEAQITSYCHNFGMQSWIFRFANIVGARSTHGVIYDFYHKLKKNPQELEILGNGKQEKSYFEVSDCVRAMIHVFTHAKKEVNCFNLGCETTTTVTRIAELLCDAMDLTDVQFNYTGNDRGWKGDVPKMKLDVSQLKSSGFCAKKTSDEAVQTAIEAIL